MDSLLQDARYALRRLLATPGFTAVAVVILAVGLGANTIVFSLVNAIFFPPAPVLDPDRVVGFAWHSRLDPRSSGEALSYPEFSDIAAHTDLFESACASRLISAPLTIGQDTIVGTGRGVIPDCFAVYGFGALRGRLLGPEDMSGAQVTVISEHLWRTRFSAREDVVGSQVRFGGRDLTIIGVARDPRWSVLWLPITMSREMGLFPAPQGFESDRTWRRVGVIARMRPGVAFEDVEQRVAGWTTAFMAEDPTRAADYALRLRRVFEHRPPPEVAGLLALSGVVLLIACGNLAGLLLARGMARVKEIAVRLTVGASRARIVRQLMLENVGLALAGGGAAIVLTIAFARALEFLDPPQQWRELADPQLDWRVFLFAVGLALATAVAFGLWPALRASRLEVSCSIAGGDVVVSGGSRRLFGARNVLLMGQFAVSALFVLVSGVFVAGYLKVSSAETGIGRPDAAAVRLDLWLTRPDVDEIRSFMERFTRRASESGDLHAVAFASGLPAGGGVTGVVRSEGPGEGVSRASGVVRVGPGLLDALGIPLLQGRDFNHHDRAETPRVALVSEAAARQWWPGQSPIGKGVYLHSLGGWHEVVGVAANTRVSLTRGGEELVYLHLAQHRSGLLIVGSSRDGSGAAAAAIRRIIHEVDPDLPVGEAKSVGQWLEGFVYGQWVYAAGFGSLAGLAMLLASLGLYGALTYAVSQRTREFGVRMALGADGPAIRRLMLLQGLKVAALGAAVGLYAAVLAVETIAKITLAVPGRGPLAFAFGPAVLIAVALVACYLPARRASRLDPVETLRAL